jgi:hypothetical protein
MSDMIFDYDRAAVAAKIPQDVLSKLVEEVRQDFPWDEMMMKLHLIRAINAYSANANKVAEI